MKTTVVILLLGLLLAGCKPPQSFTPSSKLEIRQITSPSQGFTYVVINQFFDATFEKPVEVALDRKKHQAEALLVFNHLETQRTGLSQNLKVFQIQLFQAQQLRLTRDHFTGLPADYTLPELTMTPAQ